MNENVPKLALASILSEDENNSNFVFKSSASNTSQNFQKLPPLENSTIFSPNESSIREQSSGLQFLSDHEFDLGINQLSNSPPLELRTVDSLEHVEPVKKPDIIKIK